VRDHFACPACGTKLRGHIKGATFLAIVLWTLADFIIYPIVYAKLGNDWVAVAVRIGISGGVGLVLCAALIHAFASVELEDESAAAP